METSKNVGQNGRTQNAASKILQTCLRHNQVNGEAVKTLIDLGADVTFCDENDNTVLHWAALHSRDQILKFLITHAETKGVLSNLVNSRNKPVSTLHVINGGQGE